MAAIQLRNMHRCSGALLRGLVAVIALLSTGLSPGLAEPDSARANSASAAQGATPVTPSHGAPASAPVSVSIEPRAVIGPAVPRDFLGLSFETASVPDIAGYASRGDLVSLLRSLGDGVIRFGGISADTEAAWEQAGAPPAWSRTTITRQQLAGIAGLARATGWRVLLTVNFGHDEPAAAAQEARAAQSLLGSSLEGIAIGNEPDRYVADGLRSTPWSFADYLTEVAAYRTAIAAAAPGVQIVGPDASSGGLSLTWVNEAAGAEHPAMLTEHYYPLTRCGAYVPTLAALLSPRTRANEIALLVRLSAAARAAGIPLRMAETNSVSCRGQPGVSDVFASALWATDYIVQAMASGVVGVNFHDLIGEPRSYSPLVSADPRRLASAALHANPEWYALLLARGLLGERPVRSSVARGERTLTAGAFLGANGNLHIVLVNFQSAGRPRVVRLRLQGRFRAGPVLRLSAPGLRARTAVTLGGRAVSPDGAWRADATLPRVSGPPGALQLSMPAGSAALVTLFHVG
jgi:hypothetical protein